MIRVVSVGIPRSASEESMAFVNTELSSFKGDKSEEKQLNQT